MFWFYNAHIVFYVRILMRENFEDQMNGNEYFISMSQAANLLNDPNMQTNFIEAISNWGLRSNGVG